jgi:hypothetical protein
MIPTDESYSTIDNESRRHEGQEESHRPGQAASPTAGYLGYVLVARYQSTYADLNLAACRFAEVSQAQSDWM